MVDLLFRVKQFTTKVSSYTRIKIKCKFKPVLTTKSVNFFQDDTVLPMLPMLLF